MENTITIEEPATSAGQRSNHTLISLRGVSKWYETPSGRFGALQDVDLDVRQGECIAVVGKSGSGKTTLINVITGIDSPSSGEVLVAGAAVHSMSQEQLAVWRGRNGHIFCRIGHGLSPNNP